MALFGRKTTKKDAAAATAQGASAAKKRAQKESAAKKRAAKTSAFSHVLLAPVVTEKAYILSDKGKYVFRVAPHATKAHIAKAVADIYGVDVVKVNVSVKKKQRKVFRGIAGATKVQKKAVVTVKAGQKIDLFA